MRKRKEEKNINEEEEIPGEDRPKHIKIVNEKNLLENDVFHFEDEGGKEIKISSDQMNFEEKPDSIPNQAIEEKPEENSFPKIPQNANSVEERANASPEEEKKIDPIIEENEKDSNEDEKENKGLPQEVQQKDQVSWKITDTFSFLTE